MRKTLKWTLLTVLLIAVGIVGYYGYNVYNFAQGINKEGESNSIFSNLPNVQRTKEEVIPKWEGKSRVNILLMGGDSRGMEENEVPRSDTLMIASIDPVTKKAALFSILRDTYVKIPGYNSDKINAALAFGGPPLAMKTVSDLTGLPIQYYLYTDFKGFIALVDAIGGIDIDVEKNMKYTDNWDGPEYNIDLKKGMQHLDGKTALQYVRFRHDATSDFTRTERQRKFMTAVASKVQTTSSIIKLPKILQSIKPYIETNMTLTDMVKLASLGFDIKTEGMISQQLPPNELLEEKTIKGSSVITVDTKKLQEFIRGLLNGTPSPSPTSSIKSKAEGVSPKK